VGASIHEAWTSSLDLDSILQTIMDKVAEYFRPDTWSLLMVDEGKDELYFAIAVGPASDTLKNVRLRVGEGIAGWVARHGEPLIVPDVYTDARFAKRIDEMTQWKTRSIICIPLKSKHRVLGAIQLINVEMTQFEESEIFFLQSLCDYAAIAIDNARSVERIQELTITDDCTGLYNARHLYKTLEAEVYRSARFGYEFTVLFIDLDHFKAVNDTHGHLVGSALLREVGGLIREELRPVDAAFRYGGDEFAVMLVEVDTRSAVQTGERMLARFRSHRFGRGSGLDLRVTASLGIAACPEHASQSTELIEAADRAMYLVKSRGRDGLAIAAS
jgi:diguanylate cyclase (GGDEF)-like protein